EPHDQVALLAERLRRMGDSINQLNQNYSKVVTATAGRQGLYGKVQRFKELSARTTRDLPELDFTPHEVTAEHARLEQVEPPAEHETAESIAANQKPSRQTTLQGKNTTQYGQDIYGVAQLMYGKGVNQSRHK